MAETEAAAAAEASTSTSSSQCGSDVGRSLWLDDMRYCAFSIISAHTEIECITKRAQMKTEIKARMSVDGLVYQLILLPSLSLLTLTVRSDVSMRLLASVIGWASTCGQKVGLYCITASLPCLDMCGAGTAMPSFLLF